MSAFVDTGVFYAHHDQAAEHHDAAVAAVDALLDREFGHVYTSDYVFDETVTLTMARTGDVDAAETVGNRILGRNSHPPAFEVVHLGRDDFRDAFETWRRYGEHELSFTDAATVTLCRRLDVDAVLSFDDDFDGVVDRIDPATLVR